MISYISVNNIISKNTTPNENKEIEINIIKKTFFEKYKLVIIISIIIVAAVLIFMIIIISLILSQVI